MNIEPVKGVVNTIEGLNDEPEQPVVKTAIPGPLSKELQSHLHTIQVNKHF